MQALPILWNKKFFYRKTASLFHLPLQWINTTAVCVTTLLLVVAIAIVIIIAVIRKQRSNKAFSAMISKSKAAQPTAKPKSDDTIRNIQYIVCIGQVETKLLWWHAETDAIPMDTTYMTGIYKPYADRLYKDQ